MRPIKTPEMVSIITLNWDHYQDLTGPFIRYVDNWTPDPKELIVIDQGSGELDKAALVEDARRFPWIKVALLGENVGFPAGNNVGLGEVEGEYIVFSNNDVILKGDWWTPLQERLQENQRRLVGMSLVTKGGWNEYAHDGTLFSMPYLEGWLIACHRSFIEEVGIFDEVFGKGSLEDIDLCWRAQRAGYELVGLPNLPFEHLRGRTVLDGRLDHFGINRVNYELMKRRVEEGYYSK